MLPHANGRFAALTDVLRFAFPTWFREYVELEGDATDSRMFHCQLVPGLVQTEDYARAIMETGRLPNADDLVTARMERQRILEREDPPKLWVILDEGVLRRTVGGVEVMKGQLERLRDLADTAPHVAQIIPENGKPYHGWSGSFALLSFAEGADVVHFDGFPRGYFLAEQEDVASATRAYDLLIATALPPDDSAALINSILKERSPTASPAPSPSGTARTPTGPCSSSPPQPGRRSSRAFRTAPRNRPGPSSHGPGGATVTDQFVTGRAG